MGPVRYKIVPGIHLLPTLKFHIQTSSHSLNCLAILGKNIFLLNNLNLSFKFNFLFIKSSVGEIPVVLCGVILYVNKNVFSFSFKQIDPSIFLKMLLKFLTSLFVHSFCSRMVGSGFDMQNSVLFHKRFKFFACKTRSAI